MELEGGTLYQWDTGRKVKSDAAEVHFATQPYKTYDVAVKDGAARVPDELLQRAGTLRCWAWTGSRTLEAEAFEITARNRPSGYAYEPTTQREIADAVRAKEEAQAARGEAQGFAATAKGYASAAAESAAKAEAQATEATERARDCEAAEGRAQEAADDAAAYAERAKASADAASGSAETVAQGIGDEATARADADAKLAADLAAETAGRKADTQGALEERARIEREYIAADKAFDNKLTGGLNSLSNALSTVGSSVNKAIANETADRKTADTELGTKLSEDMAAINANLGTRIDAVASVAPLVVKVEDKVPTKTFGEMQSAMLAGRPVYWTDGLLTFAAVQMEHGGLRARVGLNVSGGAIVSATLWKMAPDATAITESNYSV